MQTERVQTLVIGGGQAGLSTGYHLRSRRLPFLILDTNPRIGDAWRNRWDSLRLFTPARFDGLDGNALSSTPKLVPNQGRDGRLSGGLCATVRLTGSDRRARGWAFEAR